MGEGFEVSFNLCLLVVSCNGLHFLALYKFHLYLYVVTVFRQ